MSNDDAAGHSMRRDAIAIALYIYLTVALIPQTFNLAPLPDTLQSMGRFMATVTSSAVWVGCALGVVGRLWRDQLDGGAIEQTGLVVSCVGWLLYLWAFWQVLPLAWFGFIACGGFLVAFGTQWWLIRRWRRRLRSLAESHGK